MPGRHYQARTLVWRITRRHPRGPRPLHWMVLGSAWVHGLALVLGVAASGQSGAPEPIAVVRLDPLDRPHDRSAPPRNLAGDSPVGDPAGPPLGAPVLPAVVRPPPEATTVAPPRETIRVARTEASDAVEVPPPRWDAESRWDTVSDRPRRAPVTSERVGPLVAPTDGDEDLAGARTLERRSGDPEAQAGNRSVADAGPAIRGGGGGGRAGEGREPGTPADGGEHVAGGPAGGGQAGGSGDGIDGVRAGESVPLGPDGDRPVTAEAPDGWRPFVVRLDPTSAAPAAAAAAPIQLDGRARRDRPAAGIDEGGAAVPVEVDMALPEVAAETAGVRRVAAPGTADPADELRVALGWGPIDRSRLAPRPAWAGLLFGGGAADSSPQTALEAPIDWRTTLSTRGTALGAYVQQVEEVIAERWAASDLDVHLRAIGIAGEVSIRYVVRSDGVVSEVRVARSSGNPALDAMAIRAIPPRLPRFPRGLDERAIHHEITLRYRNPVLEPSTGAGRLSKAPADG